MTLKEKEAKIDKTYADLKKFLDEGEYEYAAMLIRTIVEIIVNSYTDYYAPQIKIYDQIPTIMDQIDALDKCSKFPKAQISNLHAMRKMGNMGSHQGDEQEVNGNHIKAMLPTIESEIKAWKSFAKEGHESLIQMDIERHQVILNQEYKKDPAKVKVSLIVSVIALGAILFFTINKTIQFFTMGLQYEIPGLLVYWICAVAFFVLAAYFRADSKTHKILFNIFALYFAAPRLYQVMLSFTGKATFFEAVIYILFAIGVIGGYSILALHSDHQKGGIVGYQ